MKKRSELLNNLILSLENEGVVVDQITEKDISDSIAEIEGIQITLESYQNAYNLVTLLDKGNALSMESFSIVMGMAENNGALPVELQVSLESEEPTSFLKNAKEKVILAFKWLIEKMSALLKKLGDYVSGALSGMKNKAIEVAEFFKNISGLKKEVFIPLEDVYLIVKDDHSLYKPNEIFEATEFLFVKLPTSCADFIEAVADNVDRSKLYLFGMETGTALQDIITSAHKKSLAVDLFRGASRSAVFTDSSGIEYYKVHGSNVAVGLGFYKDQSIIDGSVSYGLDTLQGINPKVKSKVISITDKEFSNLQEIASRMEVNLTYYDTQYEISYKNSILKSMDDLKDDIIENLDRGNGKEEQIGKLTTDFITNLITRNLQGAFRIRSESQKAAMTILASTNKLLWKVYKVESEDMSDSKELAVA